MSKKKQKRLSDLTTCGSWDWRENHVTIVNDVVDEINKLLKANGVKAKVHLSDDPLTVGTDSDGFFFSLKKLSGAEVKQISRDWNPKLYAEIEREEQEFEEEKKRLGV